VIQKLSKTTFLSLFYLLVVLLLSACEFSLADDILPPPGSEQMPVSPAQPAAVSGPAYPLVPPNPQDGAPIYAEKCAPCHGVTGLGDGERSAQLPNPPAPIGNAQLARVSTPESWYSMVTQGNLERFMPPFSSLSDRQRWDVVAYTFSLSASAQEIEAGAVLYQANCARCHGEKGQGDGPDAAGLSKPVTDLTDQSFMARRSAADFFKVIGEGMPPDMPAYASQLSEDERWSLAAYLRSLTFAPAGGEQIAEQLTVTPAITETTGATSVPPVSEVVTPTAVAVSGMGEVWGTISNPNGAQLPADMSVLLRGFDDMQVAYTQTTRLNPDGTYVFPNVEMPVGRVFMTTVEYQQATYGSDIGVVEEGLSSIELPITVYETTTDASLLRADRLHLFFEFVDSQTVRVIELYIISNPTGKTLVAAEEGEPTIRFNLPEDASNLEFQDGALGGRYVEVPGGFGDTISIQPGSGSYEALFAYLMPYDRKLDLNLKMPLPVDAVVILVPEGDINIKSDMLVDGGVRDVQGTQYRSFSGSSLQTGAELSLTLTGRPSSSAPSISAGSSTNLIVGLSAFGVALILAGVWLYRRTRREAEDTNLPAEPAVQSGESRETLMDAIIALDDLYKSGQLPEEAYLQRRAELKARLKEII